MELFLSLFAGSAANKSVNADDQSRPAAAPRRSLVAGYVRLQGLPHLSSK